MIEIITGDIGGTHARFARASVDACGRPTLGTIRKYKVSDYASFQACWAVFVSDEASCSTDRLPEAACIGFAAAIGAEQIKLTNSSWVIRTPTLASDLGLADLALVNDFEAIAYAVPRLPLDELPLLFGSDVPFPARGGVTVIGPGTGLGVAVVAFDGSHPHVIATEGGHVDFAPLDALEDKILQHLRDKFLRVSVERIVSGPGLNNLYEALAVLDGIPVTLMDDAALWEAALGDADNSARVALERFCLSYGAFAGDMALAHGPNGVVLAGGLTRRISNFLVSQSGFHARFTAKGRYSELMRSIPVRLVVRDNIGLFGAAAAYPRIRGLINDDR